MIIELKNVSKTYHVGKKEKIKALNDVSLKIEQGLFACVLGVSGSGKSTLLHIMGAIEEPSNGSVTYDGIDISKYNDKKRSKFRNKNIGFLFQDYALIPYKSVEDNLRVPLYFSDYKLRDFDSIINEKLGEIGLLEYRKRRINSLSGGQKQKVALARALVCNPSVILCDEPTGALDTCSTKEIVDLLHRINERGTTIVVVTHNPLFAENTDLNIQIEDGYVRKNIY